MAAPPPLTRALTDYTRFQTVLRDSRNIIAVAGAGLSAASGIPTFRGAGGMWRKYNAMSLATPEAFAENPSLVWQFYHYRREKARVAQPNAAHIALALFSLPSARHQLAPDSTFTLITQNVDGLSPRALEQVLSSSASEADSSPSPVEPPKIIEMHGRLFDLACSSPSCGHIEPNFASPICDALGGTESNVEKGVMDPEIPVSALPRCSKCNALARPGVVWFGEEIPALKAIDVLVDKADLCLVVGTSSTVYPAASYSSVVKSNGGKVAVFNIDPANDKDADFIFQGGCEEMLPKALGLQH